MADLKNCPFCGSEASDSGHQQWSHPVQNTTWDDGALIYESFSVNCLRCEISTRGSWGVGHRTKEAAIAAWNTRALTPKQAAADEMFEALKVLLCSCIANCGLLKAPTVAAERFARSALAKAGQL